MQSAVQNKERLEKLYNLRDKHGNLVAEPLNIAESSQLHKTLIFERVDDGRADYDDGKFKRAVVREESGYNGHKHKVVVAEGSN